MDFFSPKLVESLINAGAGALIAVLIIIVLYKLARTFGAAFIRAQQDMAQAMARQAQSLEAIRQGVSEFVRRDNSDHREMMVLLKYIAQQQEAFSRVRLEHEALYGSRCKKEESP